MAYGVSPGATSDTTSKDISESNPVPPKPFPVNVPSTLPLKVMVFPTNLSSYSEGEFSVPTLVRSCEVGVELAGTATASSVVKANSKPFPSLDSVTPSLMA